MKRVFCLAVSMMLLLCSCGDVGSRGKETDAPSNPAQSQPTETKKPEKEDVSWEITYQNSKIFRNVLDNVALYAIVEVQNTGTANLYLKDASFDFEDSSGNLLATYSTLISADPSIIAPGEKGYFYCNMAPLSGDIDENTDYVFVPSIKIEKSKKDIIRYSVSDLSISDGGMMSPINIIGRVENNTDEADSLVWVACILYREDGTPIAAHGTNITDLGAGEKVSFSASALQLSELGIELSDVSDYKVYAEKTQYQF